QGTASMNNSGEMRLGEVTIEIDRGGKLLASFRTEGRGRPISFTGQILASEGGRWKADVMSEDHRLRGPMWISVDDRRQVNSITLEATDGRDRMRLNWDRRERRLAANGRASTCNGGAGFSPPNKDRKNRLAPGRAPCRACASLAFDGEQGQQTPTGPADLHPRFRRGRRAGGTDATGRAQTRRAPPLLRSEPEMVVWWQDPCRRLVPGLPRFRLAKDHPAAHQRDAAVAQFRRKRLSIRVRLSPSLSGTAGMAGQTRLPGFRRRHDRLHGHRKRAQVR